jgi:hypothetical protein
MERQRFEDSWKESFEDAEVSPSDNVWTNIELDLEKENGSKMKRRIIFFQLLAAASIAFAMTFAGVGVYFMLQSNNTQPQLAYNTPNTQTRKENATTTTPDNTAAEKAELSTSVVQGLSNTTATNTTDETQGQNIAAAQSTPPSVTNNTGATNEANSTTAQSAAADLRHAQTNTLAEARQPRRSPAQQQPTAGASTATSANNNHQSSTQAQSRTTIARTDNPATQSASSGRAPSNTTTPGTTPADRNGTNRTAVDQSEQHATQLAQNNAAETAKEKRASQASQAVTSPTTTQASHTSQPVTVAAASHNSTKQNQVATIGKDQATQQTAVSPSVPTSSTLNLGTAPVDPEVAVAEADLSKTQGKLPAMANPAEPSLMTTSNQADPVALMLARLNDQEKQYTQQEKDNKKKDKGSERLWTSIGFAAGAYNMVTSGGGGSSAAAASFVDQQAFSATSNTALTNSIVHEQSSAPGVSYSVGLNMGTKLAARWVLQGGVNYLTQSSDYTTSAAVGSPDNSFKPASINELDKISSTGRQEARVISTAAYRVNSNLQYFSVPLQAGYLVVNRAFGLQFNAGVSTDLFLRNTLTPDGGSLEKTTQTHSDDSPYRPVNFSGLVGTEFSYRFGPHYRIALNPGLRYPFSSIYKSDITVSAMPLTFDVGLKFRYIFH